MYRVTAYYPGLDVTGEWTTETYEEALALKIKLEDAGLTFVAVEEV